MLTPAAIAQSAAGNLLPNPLPGAVSSGSVSGDLAAPGPPNAEAVYMARAFSAPCRPRSSARRCPFGMAGDGPGADPILAVA